MLDRRVRWLIAALDERVGVRPGRPSLHRRLDALEASVRSSQRVLAEALLDRRLTTLAAAGDPALPADTAAFLNWAAGPGGPAARAGLWFNPPVALRYEAGGPELLLVNERIAEQPYAFAALAGLARSARVLDLGGAESTVGLSLATLGHEVHLVDPRGSPLRHPNLHVHACRLDQLDPGLRFDAALALSAVEHFGLGAYGLQAGAGREDRAALDDIRRRLSPGATLVLTVPCGVVSDVDDFQRTYSLRDVRELLGDWEVVDLAVVWRRDALSWCRAEPGEAPSEVGAALITARRPG